MEKLLTISVAGYNVGEYIEKNLNSIIKSKYVENLEVFVVDDGGNDNTLAIAKKYAEMYPGVVIPVHKENGGYGSTVNYSVKNATGKFLKLLDGDDWFDTEGLDALVEFIIENNDVDWIVTEIERVKTGVESDSYLHRWKEYDNKIFLAKDFKENIKCGMWHTTYRLETIKKGWRDLPEHKLYTDMLFMIYPMPYIEKIGFLSKRVYCYRIGRDGQSVTAESRRKHYQEYIDNVELIKTYYYEVNGQNLPQVLQQRFFTYYKYQIFNLLLLPVSGKAKKDIETLEKNTKENMREFYDFGNESRKIRVLRKTKYLTYWPIAKWAKNNW